MCQLPCGIVYTQSIGTLLYQLLLFYHLAILSSYYLIIYDDNRYHPISSDWRGSSHRFYKRFHQTTGIYPWIDCWVAGCESAVCVGSVESLF